MLPCEMPEYHPVVMLPSTVPLIEQVQFLPEQHDTSCWFESQHGFMYVQELFDKT